MQFPDFDNDDAMAVWFEANDVSVTDLEADSDVVVSPDLTASLMLSLWDLTGGTKNGASNAAPTRSGKRALPVG